MVPVPGFPFPWNPATRENKELPNSKIYNVCMVAFGYDYRSKDYKLLAVDCQGLFEVYSLGSNSWKTIGNVPYIYTYREAEVIAIGDCHWLAKRRKDFSDVLVSPNTSNEIFKEIELPKEPLDTGFKFRNLAVLEGCLCVFVNANCVHLEVWVSGELFVYDPKNKSAMELNITRSINLYQDSYYFESLVSLNSGIYVGSG
ncbi:F-box protein At3g07870-like [Papaver somniferum]|uniref:F-box protein At3g07870-like n=1 Tax=Papaver somniferum TaxID=3469 RepID=UPI000E6F6839|nr:F-box protein At3g07870-like [Papaver somniferum]